MPYVPPHQRSDAHPSQSSSAGGSTRSYGGSFGGARGLGPGGVDRDGAGGTSSSSAVRRPLESRNSPPEIVWAKWKPSDRVLSLTEAQIADVRERLNVIVDVSEGSPPSPPPVESFEDIGLHADLMKDVTFHSYTTPTPIQAQAMPVALAGRDMLGCAETGSGKTAAFSIPMIQHCLAQPRLRHGDGPLALVLAPTRELAQQIEKEVKAFSRSSPSCRTAIIVGGIHMGDQKADLRSGVEVVVATPGRLIDHLQQGNTCLARVSYCVLDEADRMLDMGFEQQMREIMRNLPPTHQTLLFSATMPVEIESLAGEYLREAVRVKVGRVSSPTANVSQALEKVEEEEKMDRLLALLVAEQEVAEANHQPSPLTIVFVERKARCDEISRAVSEQGLRAVALHGGRSQGEREAALRDFRNSKTNILVATDVASRGLDVTGVAHVVNMDLPKALEDYVHRIGRTGRAGASGRATSFHTERDAFLVTQIRRALAEAEAGNSMAFATGRSARRKEREEAAAFRDGKRGSDVDAVTMIGATPVRVDDNYKHMLMAGTDSKHEEGAADDAWGD